MRHQDRRDLCCDLVPQIARGSLRKPSETSSGETGRKQ
jgi:hypothetical protein